MLPFLYTQDTKKEITHPQTGVKYVDLLEKDIVYGDTNNGPQGVAYYLITADTAMRPDLISKSMYGNFDQVEKMLKFNGISNPLSLDEGDILIQWDIFSLERNMRSRNNEAAIKADVRKQYITPEKKSKIDPALQEFNKRLQAKKIPDTALPPNYANFGEKEVELRNGVMVFGANVSKSSNGAEGNEPLARTEYIKNLVNNRNNNL